MCSKGNANVRVVRLSRGDGEVIGEHGDRSSACVDGRVLHTDAHAHIRSWVSTIKLLDGERLTLDIESLLITDENGPVALAGIKGGASTMIHPKTRTIFLEAAFFDPDGVARTARRYGLNTDASHRFERGVDFTLPAKAIDRASALVTQICGGRCGPRIESSEKALLPRRTWVPLRSARLTASESIRPLESASIPLS